MDKTQPKKRKFSPLLIALGILAVCIVPGLDQRMVVRQYTEETEEITHPVRLVLVTDLHSCKYGEGEQKLLDAIDELQPDLLLLGGDIFDDVQPNKNTEAFLAGISGKYPAYYVTGNHEYWAGGAAFEEKMDILSRYEITRLAGTSETIEISGETLTVCGVDDPAVSLVDASHGFEEQLANVAPDETSYSILLSHRPERFAAYAESGFDLTLCGHAHGGQVRIPGILNGLWAPDQGFFPNLAGGRYEEDGSVMIVSRGLARESTRVPRVYNRPELVVVDLT